MQGDVLTVAFPKNYSLNKESLDRKENKEIIERVVGELCSANLRLNFILVAREKQDAADTQSNPFIKSALEMFGGRIVKED